MCVGLEAGKKYFYKVRAYKIISDKKVYSKFSNIKMVKVNATKCITTNLAATPTATPTPSFVYSDELKLAESQKHTSYYFSVTEVTDDTVHLISATNAYAKDYILVKPENLDLKEGTLLKIVNPVINTESQTNRITGYSNIALIMDGSWFFKPLYVIKIVDGILYMADEPSGQVTMIYDISHNDALVTKNEQQCKAEDIKIGDKLSFYIVSPYTCGIPGMIIDCTKIVINWYMLLVIWQNRVDVGRGKFMGHCYAPIIGAFRKKAEYKDDNVQNNVNLKIL